LKNIDFNLFAINLLVTVLEPDKQVAAVLTAKGRIGAATYRITLAHAGYSLYYIICRETSLQNAPFHGRIRGPTKYTVPCSQSMERPSANHQGITVAADIPPTTENIFSIHFTDFIQSRKLLMMGFSELN